MAGQARANGEDAPLLLDAERPRRRRASRPCRCARRGTGSTRRPAVRPAATRRRRRERPPSDARCDALEPQRAAAVAERLRIVVARLARARLAARGVRLDAREQPAEEDIRRGAGRIARSSVMIMPGTKVSIDVRGRRGVGGAPHAERRRVGDEGAGAFGPRADDVLVRRARRSPRPSDRTTVWQVTQRGAQALWQLPHDSRSCPPPSAQTAAIGFSGSRSPVRLRIIRARPDGSTTTLTSGSPERATARGPWSVPVQPRSAMRRRDSGSSCAVGTDASARARARVAVLAADAQLRALVRVGLAVAHHFVGRVAVDAVEAALVVDVGHDALEVRGRPRARGSATARPPGSLAPAGGSCISCQPS